MDKIKITPKHLYIHKSSIIRKPREVTLASTWSSDSFNI